MKIITLLTSAPSFIQVTVGGGWPGWVAASQRSVAGSSLATSTSEGCSTSRGGDPDTPGQWSDMSAMFTFDEIRKPLDTLPRRLYTPAFFYMSTYCIYTIVHKLQMMAVNSLS